MSDQQTYIVELTEQNFDSAAVLNSHKLPVLIEFMGIWSGPCVLLADRLTALATEFAGQFVFAKVDIDEQPELRAQYKIENVPTLLMLKGGEVIRTETGELQTLDLHALLKDFGIFRESDALREQARERHIAGDTHNAILLLTKALKHNPVNARVVMDMAQIFLDIGELDQAKGLFARLPIQERNSDMGKAINGQLLFRDLAARTDGLEKLLPRVNTQPNDHQARFDLALSQVAGHLYEQAMDNLLQIIKQAPDFKDGAARELASTLINILMPGMPDLASNYRRKLSNLLTG